MNAKAFPIGTPSGDRYICAASNVARGEASCFARVPLRFAGERRKTCWDILVRAKTTKGASHHPEAPGSLAKRYSGPGTYLSHRSFLSSGAKEERHEIGDEGHQRHGSNAGRHRQKLEEAGTDGAGEIPAEGDAGVFPHPEADGEADRREDDRRSREEDGGEQPDAAVVEQQPLHGNGPRDEERKRQAGGGDAERNLAKLHGDRTEEDRH